MDIYMPCPPSPVTTSRAWTQDHLSCWHLYMSFRNLEIDLPHLVQLWGPSHNIQGPDDRSAASPSATISRHCWGLGIGWPYLQLLTHTHTPFRGSIMDLVCLPLAPVGTSQGSRDGPLHPASTTTVPHMHSSGPQGVAHWYYWHHAYHLETQELVCPACRHHSWCPWTSLPGISIPSTASPQPLHPKPLRNSQTPLTLIRAK